MKPFLPMIALVVSFLLFGIFNIFDRWQAGESIRRIDYAILMVMPIGIVYCCLIFLIIKLSLPAKSQHKQ